MVSSEAREGTHYYPEGCKPWLHTQLLFYHSGQGWGMENLMIAWQDWKSRLPTWSLLVGFVSVPTVFSVVFTAVTWLLSESFLS